MLSLVMIPLLVKKGLIVFQNDLLPFFAVTFRKHFFSVFGQVVAFGLFFHLYRPRRFP